jgi:ABC-type proline/glycine betaine transport system permease subunit
MSGQRQRSATKKQVLSFLIAFLFPVSAAMLAILLFGRYDLRSYVPLGFILVAVVVAERWGASGTILGLLASATLFAVFLFRPIGSLRVSAEAARGNLEWMLLLGVPAAYLFSKPPSAKNPPSQK